jgi:hypothetical protein
VADAADDYDLGPDMIDQGNGALRSYLGDQNRAFSTGMQGYGGALDYLRGHPYPTQSRGYLELAAGLLSPTKSGGWAESFGKGASNLSKVQDTNYKEEFERNMKIADIQKLQSELYKQRGDAQWQGFEHSAQVPKLAAEAAAGRQLYHDYRTPGLTAPGRPANTETTPAPPTSQVPVSPDVPAPTPVPTAQPAPDVPDVPPPRPQSSLLPPNAATARASLRTPRTDVAGDYAVPQGPMTPMPQPAPRPTQVAELYRVPDGTPRPQEPGSVIKQPERTRGQYPSPTGLERTPGAPNYDFTPPDPRSPGGAIPGGSLPNTRIGAAEQVLDDNGRPINPASLAASGTTATDAPSPADDAARAASREAAVAAGRKANPGAPAPQRAPIGNSPATSGGGSTMPDVSSPPVKIPTSGSREETNLKEAPTASDIAWAKQIKETISGHDARLTVNRAGPRGDDWRTKQAEADEILKKADAALTVARQQSAAQVEAWKSSPGHERDVDMLKAKNKRDQELLERAQEAEQDANNRGNVVDSYDRAYRAFLTNHPLFGTGPVAGFVAQGDDNYSNLDRAGIMMQDLKAAGPGSVSDKEGKKIAATSVGPMVNDRDTETFLVQQRGEILKSKEYAKFLRTWAQKNGGDMDGANNTWQQIQDTYPVVAPSKDDASKYELHPENAERWRHYLGVDGKPADPKAIKKNADGSVVIDGYTITEH